MTNPIGLIPDLNLRTCDGEFASDEAAVRETLAAAQVPAAEIDAFVANAHQASAKSLQHFKRIMGAIGDSWPETKVKASPTRANVAHVMCAGKSYEPFGIVDFFPYYEARRIHAENSTFWGNLDTKAVAKELVASIPERGDAVIEQFFEIWFYSLYIGNQDDLARELVAALPPPASPGVADPLRAMSVKNLQTMRDVLLHLPQEHSPHIALSRGWGYTSDADQAAVARIDASMAGR